MSNITARLNTDTDIYSGPGESYETVDHIHSDGVLNVLWREGDWYYVSCSPDDLVFNTDTVYGYVHGSVLIDMTGTPEEAGGGTDTDPTSVTATTNNDSDIFSGPGEGYDCIDHIVAGETVTIISDAGEWCKPSGVYKNTAHYLPKIYDFMTAESVLGFDVDVLAIVFHDHFERSGDFEELHKGQDENGNEISIEIPSWDDVKTSRRVFEAEKFYRELVLSEEE